MSKRKAQDNDMLMQNLTIETQEIINKKFLLYYKSKRGYRSAILRMLNNEINKEDALKITYTDYEFIKNERWPDESQKKPAQFTYRESFFKFLYAFDYLQHPAGFNKKFIKEKLIKEFNNKLEIPNKKEPKEYIPHLTLQEIISIENIINVSDDNDISKIKEAFSWYMLFHTNCSVDSLRYEIKAENYIDSKIVLENGEEYYVPKRFTPLFDYLRSRTYTGFDLDLTIIGLGKKIGINKLMPGEIKHARKENSIICQSCGNSYINITDNWKAINGRIVCRYCVDNIKKNYNFEITDIHSEEVIDDITNDIEKSSVFFTYDQLKNKMSKEINYLDLHKYLIEIGKLGEAYVYDYEKKKLLNSQYEDKVDNTPALDSYNGYDIKSFEINGEEIYIEVKTTTKGKDDFYLSDHEFKTAKEYSSKNKNYYIYRVYNILAENKEDITIEIIKDIANNNKYLMKPINYKVEKIKI